MSGYDQPPPDPAVLAQEQAIYELVLLPALRGWAIALLTGRHPAPPEERYPASVSAFTWLLPLWYTRWRWWVRKAWHSLTQEEREALSPWVSAELASLTSTWQSTGAPVTAQSFPALPSTQGNAAPDLWTFQPAERSTPDA